MAWVYILQCADGLFYTGSTRNLDIRGDQHGSGFGSRFTSKRQPVVLVFAQEFSNIGEAWEMERRIHGWSRAKKIALIESRYNDLPRLARGRNRKPLPPEGSEESS